MVHYLVDKIVVNKQEDLRGLPYEDFLEIWLDKRPVFLDGKFSLNMPTKQEIEIENHKKKVANEKSQAKLLF